MTAHAVAALATGLILARPALAAPAAGQPAIEAQLHSYVVEFLRRNPTVNTYLGGAGLDPSLRAADGRLRDHSAAALKVEDRWLTSTLKALQQIDARPLSANLAIDREVALAQIRFLLHQHQVRRYQERALDTYTDEPFRAIDWQLQGMTSTGSSTAGTSQEWSLVLKRLQAIPRFLKIGQTQIEAGRAAGNTPDPRALRRNGLDTTEADAKFFDTALPQLIEARLAGPDRDRLLPQLRDASRQAAVAYRQLRDFVARVFFTDPALPGVAGVKPPFRADRFVLGEAEYDWALANNFRITDTAAGLYRDSWPIVQATRREMIDLALAIGKKNGWNLALPKAGGTSDSAADGGRAVRAVFDQLSRSYPQSDVEMISWYRETAFRLVAYARQTGLFEVPADYQLEVVETPEPLRTSIDGAAYYPAPPFQNTGVGRFYVTPTGNNRAALQTNNRAALADLAAHEGFPGHDWNYKVAAQARDSISPVRWLTPGGVEDSSSMWEDSLAAEGWALYAEALMAEPQPAAPHGFYTPEERLYQLHGKLYRDLRVRIDSGIHTGRLTYAQAVDLFSETVDYLPGSCADATVLNDAATGATKRASCDSAERAIYRYSMWPTQAIAYRLGKDQILALRNEAARLLGDKFSAQAFHLLFMKQGTIPPGYFREELLRQLQAGLPAAPAATPPTVPAPAPVKPAAPAK
jgi:uncharacterized protein (DUF885 family)